MSAPFPNAAPPPGALFDNALASVPQTLPAHLTPATRIAQVRGGAWAAVDVMMQHGQPISLDLALKRVRNGRTVFVAREDAGRVLESLRPTAADLASLNSV